MHWEVLPHPVYSPDLAPSEFHLFGPLKEALGGNRFTADDEFELLVQWLLDKKPPTPSKRGAMKAHERQRLCGEVM